MPDTHDHKLVIRCPVADKPEIFNEINGSITNLHQTISRIEGIADHANKTAVRADKRVDRIYVILGFLLVMAPIIFQLYHIFKPTP